MEQCNIKNFPDIVKEHFPNKEIKNVTVQQFPLHGYGSIMLRVDFTTKNKTDGVEEEVHAVGKTLPQTEERRDFFNVQVTFKTEANFYQNVIPALKALQIENGVTDGLSMFPECYGARINLDESSSKVTGDAVLVLENLVEAGFKNIDRKVGFDLDSTKVLLRDLARYHGTLIALKFKKPEVFEKFKHFCSTHDFGKNGGGMLVPQMAIIKENPECAPLAPLISNFFEKKVSVPREPYACITHCDMWVNNTMQKFENDKLVENKFVDFQILDFRSCAADVFFFLWTSAQKYVIEEHLDDMIKFYHDNLVKTVEDLKCDVSSFSLKKFYEEIRLEANYEFTHSLMFAFIIKGPLLDKALGNEKAVRPKPEEMVKRTPLSVKEYLWFMTLECNKRGWIY